MTVPVERRVRRWYEQRWVIDNVIQANGVEWDQPRIGYTMGPCGPEAAADFNMVRARVRRFADMPREFASAARRREARAGALKADGHLVSARESYFIAATLWGAAQWAIFENTPETLEYDRHKTDCYLKWAKYAPQRVERVEIPYRDGQSLPAYLHFPRDWDGRTPLPCVLATDGMDSSKEITVAQYGDKLLERGMAVLAMDGPGQGECLTREIHITPTAFKDAGRAALDWLRARPEIDGDRLAIYGVSFGSFWATQMAEGQDRLRACAGAFVCHEPGADTLLNAASPSFKMRYMYMAGLQDEADLDAMMPAFRLDGAAVRCPYLVVAGEDDELSPIEHTHVLMAQVTTPKTLLLYQGERHSINGPAGALGPNWQTFLADWLRDRMDGKPLASAKLYVDTTGRVTPTAY